MKKRNGFVSNSSTSSFVCGICGYTEGYYDGNDINDYGVLECTNGHVFCESHISEKNKKLYDDLKNFTYEDENLELIYKILSQPSFDNEPIKLTLENFKLLSKNEIEELIEKYNDVMYNISSYLCPICNFEKINIFDNIDYLLKKLGMSEEEYLNEIKEKFNDDYIAFKRHLKGMK